jgi:outer membrane protein assembly factor BamB
MTGKRVVSVSPSDGKLYWEHPWSVDFDINAAEPVVVSPSRVIVSSGYGKGAALLEISKEGPAFRVQTIWENKNLKNKFNSSVFYEGHVYGLDEGILACIQASTGERRWKGGRYGFGQLILADGHLIVLTEQGRAVLVKAVPDSHRELASFQAIEEGKTWNHPALAGGLLLVRNTTEMACYDLRR